MAQSIQGFRTYDLALQLHQACKAIQLPGYLKDQLLRASSSVALNLAEGSGKPSKRDRVRFYAITLGSLREVQACADLEGLDALKPQLDVLVQVTCFRSPVRMP
jgi:four helix bundle protein